MELSRRKALSQTMVKVRANIEQIRGRGEHVSEQDTKSILIEPMLAALGWELNELDDVRREYRYKSQDNPVDYALFIFGRPRRALNLGLYICSRRSAAFPMVRSGAAPRGVARESPSTLAASRRRLHIDVLSRLSFKVITPGREPAEAPPRQHFTDQSRSFGCPLQFAFALSHQFQCNEVIHVSSLSSPFDTVLAIRRYQ
jgi:hypothetical protein